MLPLIGRLTYTALLTVYKLTIPFSFQIHEYANHPTLTASNRHIAQHYLASLHRPKIRTTALPSYSKQSMVNWYGLDTDTPLLLADGSGRGVIDAKPTENSDVRDSVISKQGMS